MCAVYAAMALAMVFGPHVVGDVFTETDFYGSYGPGARMLQHGHIEAARYGVVGPLFEMLLALLGFAVRDLFLAAELIAVAAMTTTLVCWHSLLARRAGPAVALLAVTFMAANAQFFRFGWSVTTDAPALAFQAAALWTLFGTRDGVASPRRVFVGGVLAGLAFLTRYSSVALLPAGLAAVALGWSGAPAGSRVRHALLFLGGFLAPVAPWFVVLRHARRCDALPAPAQHRVRGLRATRRASSGTSTNATWSHSSRRCGRCWRAIPWRWRRACCSTSSITFGSTR